MKKQIVFSFILALFALSSTAQKIPDWIINKPSPTNSTYLYVVESATGQTEQIARNLAIAEVFRSTAMRIGQPFDSEEINRALQRGTEYYVISSQYNIPINKVCEYTDNKTSPCRVYILCQVAKAGNIRVEFDEFNSCYEGVNRYYADEALAADGFNVYKNGRLISEPEVRSLLANSQAYEYYDKGMDISKSEFFVQHKMVGLGESKRPSNLTDSEQLGYMSIGFGIGFLISGIAAGTNEGISPMVSGAVCALGASFVVVGGGILITRAALISSGKKNIRKAIDLYNNGKMYSHQSVDVECGLAGSNVYLTFRF